MGNALRKMTNAVALCLATAWVWLLPTAAFADEGGADMPPEVPSEGTLPEWDEFLEGFLALDLFSIPLWRLGLSLLVLLLGFSLRGFLLDKLLTPVQLVIARTESELDDHLMDAIRSPLGWVVNLVAIYFSLVLLEPPASIMVVSTLVMQTIGTVLVAWVVYKIIDVAAMAMSRFASQTPSEMDDHLVPLVRRVLRVSLFVIVGIAIIQQWGYDATSLLAGLGIGGLAFALAAKPTLSNWFGSVMIFTDRPFTMGDWVKTDVGEGIVEEVGLRSTKIRTFTDTLITVPNANIATGAIENCSAMKMRRIRTHIGLIYATSRDQLQQVLEGIDQAILDNERIDDDTRKVFFDQFSASSLEILVQCWALTTSYDEFMEIKQQLYLDIMAVVEEAGSEFAFPSQTVYLERQ